MAPFSQKDSVKSIFLRKASFQILNRQKTLTRINCTQISGDKKNGNARDKRNQEAFIPNIGPTLDLFVVTPGNTTWQPTCTAISNLNLTIREWREIAFFHSRGGRLTNLFSSSLIAHLRTSAPSVNKSDIKPMPVDCFCYLRRIINPS